MKHALIFGLSLLFPLAASAADFTPLDVKPGLWESTITTEMRGAPPIPAEDLQRLTPQQRARLEAALKAQEGKGPQTRVTTTCVTPEQLREPLALDPKQASRCKNTLIDSSAKRQEVRIDCSEGSVQTTGTLHLEATDSEHVKGTSQVDAVGADKKMHVQASYSAKWLGADCGKKK